MLNFEPMLNLIFFIRGEFMSKVSVQEIVKLKNQAMSRGIEVTTSALLASLALVLHDKCGVTLEDIAKYNYKKLLKRYPYGFEVERSINREV